MPRSRPSPVAYLRTHVPFVALAVLLASAFLLGGGSRDDIVSLIALRPIAVICLGIGLYGLTGEQWRAFRLPLGMMAAIIGLILLHLIPLPPAIWQAIPGRELAIAAGEAAGGIQPWRELSLVPYRGWNAFYAMLVPAAAMVLAVQIDREDHRKLLYVLIAAAIASALWGMVQAIGGFGPGLYFYDVTNSDSPTGFFANRNHMAAMQVCILPLLALIAARAKGPRMRLIQTACAAIAVLAVMMAAATGSRAGIALALVALAASWLVWNARPRHNNALRRRDQRQRWVPFAFAGFGAAMLGGFALLLTRSQSFERISGTSPVEEYRFLVWETMVEFLPQYLPFGSGIGSFVEIFQVHEPSAMLGTSYWNHAHNDWLEWTLEGGIPAVLLMIVALVAFVRGAFALLSLAHTGRFGVQLGLAGAIILFVLGLWSAVDYPLRVPALAVVAALASVWMAFPRANQALQGLGRAQSGQSAGKPVFMSSEGSFATRPSTRANEGTRVG
ncbi:O-antigen ligase [Erythrobacter sp. JK5]|uniref:O-antigen ligase family protein n=1 Tax=Erythrobacter sp. JK5 TaxID=2829500 RepID=UPI001BA80A46|nr:O-antigen ligase family protein [Erythrobacter sp. JK5]QUL37319.1 O-antigen ligase family protein [Erythrobacter sp. JK5]